MNHKERFYLILGGIVILVLLSLSIFLFMHMRDKERMEREQELSLEEQQEPQKERSQYQDGSEQKENAENEQEEEQKNQTEREVNKDVQKWESEKENVEDYINSNPPSFEGVTEDVASQFLADDTEFFWHELGIYIHGNFGIQVVEKVEFLNLASQEDRTSCVMKVTDMTGDSIYLSGIYYPEAKCYEFYSAPDIYTYDASEDIGEGGL